MTTLPYLGEEFTQHIPLPNKSARVLDLGCGTGRTQESLEEIGYEWVGIDINGDGPLVYGDAHQLPFEDDTFDLVLSSFVLEHLRRPWIAAEEVKRVLSSGGLFVGTVAFLEDFHGESYYHHSENGTRNTLELGGLTVEKVEPFDVRPGLRFIRWDAHYPMMRGMFPKSPRKLRYIFALPLYLLHRLWYWIGGMLIDDENATEEYRRKKLAGQFLFVARA